MLGPIIRKRAETIGEGQLNAGLSYSYVRFTGINGQSLHDLENVPTLNGRVVSNKVGGVTLKDAGGVRLKDGRFTNFLPIQVNADIDVEAQLLTPSLTYGITADLDVNLTLPLIRTYFAVHGTTIVPDPRLPEFALPDDMSMQGTIPPVSDSAVGIGDLLLRGKWMLLRERPVDLAAALGVSFPTGDQDDFAATGTYQVRQSSGRPPALCGKRLGDETRRKPHRRRPR